MNRKWSEVVGLKSWRFACECLLQTVGCDIYRGWPDGSRSSQCCPNSRRIGFVRKLHQECALEKILNGKSMYSNLSSCTWTMFLTQLVTRPGTNASLGLWHAPCHVQKLSWYTSVLLRKVRFCTLWLAGENIAGKAKMGIIQWMNQPNCLYFIRGQVLQGLHKFWPLSWFKVVCCSWERGSILDAILQAKSSEKSFSGNPPYTIVFAALPSLLLRSAIDLPTHHPEATSEALLFDDE